MQKHLQDKLENMKRKSGEEDEENKEETMTRTTKKIRAKRGFLKRVSASILWFSEVDLSVCVREIARKCAAYHHLALGALSQSLVG